ncbi:MAG: hypothetical protein SV377_03155, partial [Halobacteria archaeon]|nr:hypothetical protein [Halobacteria archaeon]
VKPADSIEFSELMERVGAEDSGNFNYHLNKLTGRFIRQTDEGYSLRGAGSAVIRAMIKGTITDDVSLDTTPVDAKCPYCGSTVVIEYNNDRNVLFTRCSSCEPPVALLNRTAEEVFLAGTLWIEHHHMLRMKGVCPECTGATTSTLKLCEDHTAEGNQVCENCGSNNRIQILHVCSVCKLSSRLSAWIHIFTHPTVQSFYFDHGFGSFGPDYFKIWPKTIENQELVSEDPVEIEVAVNIDGDRLNVLLNEAGDVISVDEINS